MVRQNMNFCNMNPMNVRLNVISGNLLPLTGDGKLYHVGWRIHGVVVWLLIVIQFIALILGAVSVPRDKVIPNSVTVIIEYVEVFLLFAGMYSRRNLISQLIRKMDDMLYVADEIMRSVIISSVKSVVTPLKFYYITSFLSAIVWYLLFFLDISKKQQFFYEDYTTPVVFSNEPFSRDVFVLGNIFGCVTGLYILSKNAALNIYMMNIVLLMTALYRYIATELANIFRQEMPNHQFNEDRKSGDFKSEMEMKTLCRQYNALVLMMPMLNQILASNFSLIYMTNVFRLSFIGIMAILSTSPLEILLFAIYLLGVIVQLYILCSCVHQLLDASVEITHEAFHEKWYQYGPSVKRSFLFMILSNNLELELSTFGKYNMSLPSFMTILNQAYTIVLLFARVK